MGVIIIAVLCQAFLGWPSSYHWVDHIKLRQVSQGLGAMDSSGKLIRTKPSQLRLPKAEPQLMKQPANIERHEITMSRSLDKNLFRNPLHLQGTFVSSTEEASSC